MSNAGPLTAAHFVIATGSMVAPPPLSQFHDVGYRTSEDALKLLADLQSGEILGGANPGAAVGLHPIAEDWPIA